MTSAPIKNPVDVMYVARPDSTQSPKGESDFAGNLKSAVEKSGQNAAKSLRNGESEKAVKKPEVVKANKKELDKNAAKASKAEGKKGLREKKQLTDDQSDAVMKKIDSLVQKVQKVTGADEEKVLQAMEDLGIAGADLFAPENMTNLLMELTETEDPMELVTDEDLFASLQDLNAQAADMMEQMQEEMGLSPEDMQEVMDQVTAKGQDVQMAQPDLQSGIQTAAENAGVPAAEAVGTEKTAIVADQTDDPKGPVPENETVAVNAVQEESETASEETTDGQNTASDENGFSKETDVTKETGEKTKTSHEHRVNQNDAQPANNQFVQNIDRQLQTDINAVQEGEAVSYTERTAETQRIADQIMEHMKVQMKEGITELEMQLHPASLGNVNVSLVSREGNITAQFTAQNEAVKNAIETQIVQLKEQFEEQGIKVEAVEVAVASHQFERQYNGEEQRESQRSQTAGTRRTRRINLETLSEEEIDKLMEDADKIQVDMMNRNGNTVDFTV